MQTAVLTVRVPKAVKRRIAASAQQRGVTPHQWAVDTLTQAAGASEARVNWDSHFAWLHKQPQADSARVRAVESAIRNR